MSQFKGLVAALSLWNVLDHGGALAGALGPLVATLLGALQVRVVPASSQTVSGEAAGIVLADHEDVIGHFDGQENTTLFKSGSGFTRARFTRLWADVAARLGR